MSSSKAGEHTLNSCLKELASTRPDSEAFVFYNEALERSSISYQEFFALASRFAKILHDAGLKKGDYVVNSLPTCVEEVVTSMGIYLAGGVHIPVEIFFTTGETFFDILQRTEAKYLILPKRAEDFSWNLMKNSISPSSKPNVDPMVHEVKNSDKLAFLRRAFVVSRSEDSNGFIDHLRKQMPSYICSDVTEDDLSFVASTANPNLLVCLVAHSHGSVVRGGENSRNLLRGSPKYLYTKPPTWGSSVFFDVLVWGTTRVGLDRWLHHKRDQNEIIVDIIEREKVQFATFMPPEVEALLEKWKPRPLPMLDQMIITGMPLTEKVARRIKPAATAMTIRYISSEVQMCTYNTLLNAEDYRDFDNGFLHHGVQVKVVDDEYNELPNGKTGMLWFKAQSLFTKYIGQPQEDTDSKFTSDGWYITGDAGCMQEDGHLLVMGRKDDMIMHNVWNIHPSWIEKDIRSHPDVEKVVVVPVPDDYNFQNICACVIKKPGSAITFDDIINHFKSNYIDEEKDTLCPNEVLFFENFPETRPGRVDREKLEDLATDLVAKAKLAK